MPLPAMAPSTTELMTEPARCDTFSMSNMMRRLAIWPAAFRIFSPSTRPSPIMVFSSIE